MGNDTIYHGSDGQYYGEVDVWERFESGEWSPVCWDERSGEEWVETTDGDLLALAPVPTTDSPEWLEVEITPVGARIRNLYPHPTPSVPE